MNRLTLLATASAIILAACSTEEIITDSSAQEVSATYTVSLPADMSTRAYSDGRTATYLTYAVYRDGELVGEQLRKNQFADLTATVSLQLVKGFDYTIVFWADAGPKCPYTIDLANGTVTMDYATTDVIDGNDEARDAFYQVVTLEGVSTSVTGEVELYRPLAQLNFGSNDLKADIICANAPTAEIEFSVTLPAGLPTVFNLADGSTDGESLTQSAIQFVSTGLPAESDGTFPVDGYEYISMNYLLCPPTDDGPVVLCGATTLTASHTGLGGSIACTAYNVPLQRNYRTNIYGGLLTNPMEYSVTISPQYNDDFFIMERNGVFYRAYCDADMLLDAIKKGFNVALMKDMAISEAIDVSSALSIYLNGYTLTIESSEAKCISSASDISIYDGALSLSSSATSDAVYGVYTSGYLTMDNVTMTMASTAASGYEAHGVYASADTKATITNSSITASNTGDGTMAAVMARCADLIIDNCDIAATGTSGGVYGLRNYTNTSNSTSTVSVTSSTISATSESGEARGVYNNSISEKTNTINPETLTDSEVTAASSTSTARAIHNNITSGTGDVTLSNSTATANGKNAFGVYNYITGGAGTITVTGSEVSTTATGDEEDGSYAAYNLIAGTGSGAIEVTDSKVSATATGTSGIARAAYNNLNVAGGQATMNITDSDVSATATGDEGTAYGAYNNIYDGGGTGTITLTGGTLSATATGTSGTARGVGNFINLSENESTSGQGTITLTGTTLTVEGATTSNVRNTGTHSAYATVTIDGAVVSSDQE